MGEKTEISLGEEKKMLQNTNLRISNKFTFPPFYPIVSPVWRFKVIYGSGRLDRVAVLEFIPRFLVDERAWMIQVP